MLRHSTKARTKVSTTILDENNEPCTDLQSKLQSWEDYFSTLLNRDPPVTADNDLQNASTSATPDPTISIDPPSLAEVQSVIRTLKSDKSPGRDKVCAEYLKADLDGCAAMLHRILVRVWESEEAPDLWKVSDTVLIFKKGNTTLCNNYRGISLLSIIGELYVAIIQLRVQSVCNSSTHEEQAGFRPGRGCYDQIFTLRQITERYRTFNKPLVATFIDFSAAFDSVHRDSLWSILRVKGIPDKIIRLLRNLYDGCRTSIRVYNATTQSFAVKTGVRQGCIFSPLLFNAAIDWCMSRALINSPQQRPVDQRTAVNMAIDQPNNTVGDPEAISQVLVSSSDAIWMQTARVAVHDPAGERHIVRILFDTGSHRSYITQTLARKLSLPTVKTEVIKVGTFGGQHARPQSYDVVEVQCSNPANNIAHSITTIVVPQITCPVYRAPVSSKIPAFKQLKLADPPSIHGQWMDIDILVGLDYYWQLVQDQVLRLPDHGLTAVSSVFGWLVSGSAATPHNTQSDATTLFTMTCPAVEDSSLTKFWDSETFDCPSPLAEEKDQGELVLERFEKTIQFKDGRYEVGLPWKTQASDLPTNERLCRNRFNSLVRRLKREDVMQQYSDVIEQQAKLQFIEKVDDPSFSSGPVHYIPHHPVIKKDHATTKLRIVYDASAQQTPDDPSLNDSLYSGPNMVSSLIMLLLLFRSYAIVLLADIEKAFLQVALLIEDRDATRFLWLKDINKPPTDDNIEVWRFRRVPFGATSSPFLLAATLHYHLSLSTEPVAAKMTGQFYVDNLIVGVESNSEAIQVYHDAKRLMSTAGMNLREWMCNVPEVMEQIPPHDQAKGDEVKVLGLPWSIADDIIHTKSVPEMNVAVAPTKRHILQTIAKIFDPMGLVSPVVIAAKIFIQSLWKQNIGWDDQPSDVLIEQWRHLNHQLATVHSIAIQRRLLVAGSSQLHVFADASSKAYAAVAYIRTPKDGTYISQLAFSKSRVVPIKPSSTPRLELVAALLGCKLAAFLVECFPVIQSVKMWSDSQVVLHWIHNNPSKQGAFVTNRVRQIQAYQYPFRYCNTTENPADLPSRGRETADLGSSNLWWHGPAWLSSPEESWPEDIPKCNPSCIDVEHPENEAVAAIANAFVPEPPFSMTLSNYSSLNKLLRVTALCSRFVSKLRRQPADTGAITAEELAQAKIRWITHVQLVHYQPQFACLASGKPDRLTRQFGLFLENNIIKCHGRFQHSDIHCNDVILLPKNDHFTYLVIAAQHNLLYHQGVRHTLAEIRRSYWIPQGRQQVRSILKRCYL